MDKPIYFKRFDPSLSSMKLTTSLRVSRRMMRGMGKITEFTREFHKIKKFECHWFKYPGFSWFLGSTFLLTVVAFL